MQSLGIGLSAIWLTNAASGSPASNDFIELESGLGNIELEDDSGVIQLEV